MIGEPAGHDQAADQAFDHECDFETVEKFHVLLGVNVLMRGAGYWVKTVALPVVALGCAGFFFGVELQGSVVCVE